MINYNEIQHVHLELTTLCNAACAFCPRNIGSFPYDTGYPLISLSLSDIKTILPVEFVKQINTILLNGNYGDQMMAADSLPIIRYFRETNSTMDLCINTNGSARNEKYWQELAKLNATVYFGIDGLEDTHSIHRINTDFKKVIKNAKTFIDAGGIAIWKMVGFKHNLHQLDECERLSRELGFRDFMVQLTGGRHDGPVYDKNGNYSYTIGESEFTPKDVNQAIEWIKQATETHEYDETEICDSIFCDTKRNKSIYIAANGEVYPCCYLGFFPKLDTLLNLNGKGELKELLLNVNNNALEHPLEQCIEWFNKVEETWAKSSFKDGRLYQCNLFCGVKTQ